MTAGYMCPEPRAEFFAAIDAANVDLKSFDDDFYRRLCGARLAPVLETLRYLKHETSVWLELTTLLIPQENDMDAELDALTACHMYGCRGDTPVPKLSLTRGAGRTTHDDRTEAAAVSGHDRHGRGDAAR